MVQPVYVVNRNSRRGALNCSGCCLLWPFRSRLFCLLALIVIGVVLL